MDEIEEDAPRYTEADLNRIGKLWLDRIAAAEKREDAWRQEAEAAEAAYLVDTSHNELPDFNILHSNVETIVPAIFNSSPKPEIRPRHNAQDQGAKLIADMYERAITTLIDDNALDREIEVTAQDTFVAGRGVTRIKFDADDAEIVDALGNVIEETVINERVLFENVSWRDYREGPAKRWKDVPWVCFRHEISQAEKERLENPEITSAYQKDEKAAQNEELECTVWEVWCKETKRVYFVVEESGRVLDIMDDPLGLDGFFPLPAPIQPIQPSGKRTPTCPYAVYKRLAEELDLATQRINKIMKGLKVRGIIPGNAQALEELADADDNMIVPIGDIENLVALGGLDKAIMWWPVDKAIAVLQQLYVQREQIKQSIYELTGISDIVRGASDSGETATAQQIKTQWGSLRIKKMQRQIERHIRDLFVLTAEVMGKHFGLETMQKLSGVTIPPELQQVASQPLDNYRIDIESDSTVRADLTKSRGEMSEFLNGTATFFQAMAPVVGSAPQAAEPLARMYASFARQFNLGKDAEDALEQFVMLAQQAAQQPQSDPAGEAMKAEMDLKNRELELKFQDLQAKMQLEVQKLQLQAQNLGLDAEIKRVDLALKRDDLKLRERQGEFDAAAKVAEIEMEQDQERPVAVGQ